MSQFSGFKQQVACVPFTEIRRKSDRALGERKQFCFGTTKFERCKKDCT